MQVKKESKQRKQLNLTQRHKLIGVGVMLLVVLAGYAAFQLGAAGFFASFEAEQGALDRAQVVNDQTASDGRAVQFAQDTVTPPPPPSTERACPPLPAFPNADCTGVPAGKVSTLTPSEGIEITTPGTVIDGKDITGCVWVRAANVVIKNTRIKVGGSLHNCTDNFAAIRVDGDNLVVQDVEIDGQRHPDCGFGLAGAYTARRVHVHDCIDGFRNGEGNVTIEDSYFHSPSNNPGDHGDGYQCYYSSGPNAAPSNPTVVRHNTMVGGTDAAFFTADYCRGPLLVDGNLFMGEAGFVVRLYDNDVTFTNNRVVNKQYPDPRCSGCTLYGTLHTFFGTPGGDIGTKIVSWSNNVLVSNFDGSGIVGPLEQPK